MKLGVLFVIAPLGLAACATQQSAQMLDAKVQRGVKACIDNGWMHDGIIPYQHTAAQRQRVIARRRDRVPGAPGVYPIPGPPDLPRIERRCR